MLRHRNWRAMLDAQVEKERIENERLKQEYQRRAEENERIRQLEKLRKQGRLPEAA